MQFDEIIKLIHTVSNSSLETFSLEDNGFKLSMTNKFDQIKVIHDSKEIIVQSGNDQDALYIESPLVGTFYTAKAEGVKPFISVGDKVVSGQVIGIIEAMKLMNEITSNVDGIVEEILVENEQTVEYGQPLVKVRKSE